MAFLRKSNKKSSDSPLRMSKAKSRKFILGEDTKFIITEAYKSARTNLMFSLSANPNKVITFTSSSPAEGKSTTCINMAITFAATGSKVLLIDSDMRKPAIHSLLKLEKTKGLSSVLGGMCTVAEAINSNVRENLDVIVAGPLPPNPAELIGSPNMAELIDVLRNHYDYILIDTPPVNVVSDSQLYNQLVAGMVFVIRDGVTTHTDIHKAMKNIEMANGKVLGFIKTACQSGSKGSSYKKSYYNYDYSYGNNASVSNE